MIYVDIMINTIFCPFMEVQVPLGTVPAHVRSLPHQSDPQLVKMLGFVPSYLCDWSM